MLPYHAMGQYKWKELGIPYSLEGVESPGAERVKNAERILRGESGASDAQGNAAPQADEPDSMKY